MRHSCGRGGQNPGDQNKKAMLSLAALLILISEKYNESGISPFDDMPDSLLRPNLAAVYSSLFYAASECGFLKFDAKMERGRNKP